MIIFIERYYRSTLRLNPTVLFVFGDNLQRTGYGGQAKECRGEPNAVGLPTKRAPDMRPGSFLTDADLNEIISCTLEDLDRLREHLRNEENVIWPADGIGTGLARLAEHAPSIALYYKTELELLKKISTKLLGDLP